MRRPWQIAAVFGGCLAVLLVALGWATVKLLELDRAQQRAAQQAVNEEAVRLALWRMDSALGPLIAEESTRPYFTYAAFYPATRAYDAMLGDFVQGEVLLPSPLLVESPPLTVVHFQIDEGGRFVSPQAPDGRTATLAQSGYATPAALAAARARLLELETQVDATMLRSLTADDEPGQASARAILAPGDEQPEDQSQRVWQTVQSPQAQAQMNDAEYNARFQNADKLVQNRSSNSVYAPPAAEVRVGALKPIWVDEVLLLARRVQIGDAVLVQGCQLDWPAIRQLLRTTVADLLPNADVRAVPANGIRPSQESIGGGDRWLAALPLQLVPGEQPVAAGATPSALRWSLIIGWVCVLLATTAVATLLIGTIALSERRAAFVSAVTHELRTPLTTFRMYTELLADGVVKDPAKQQQYYDVLNTEARRLGHLVENVLAYARLDGGRSGARLETLTAGSLFERAKARLEQRAGQVGVPLALGASAEELALPLRVDVAAVEQILFNLVDNACKYAVPRGATAIRVEVGRADGSTGGLTFLRVRDDGPGVPAQEARRLFRPFHKSARDAAHSAPGVGLGLALSRRLARSMGGDLRLDAGGGGGACFVLVVPRS